jgi:hypothetical protein
MKWMWNRCRRRQEVCLLAAGALGQEEKAELGRHLAACEECRNYFGEIKTLTAPLAGWEKKWSAVEATPAARMRWARAVREAVRRSAPNPNPNPNLNLNRQRPRLGMGLWRLVWGEFFFPHRYAWSGMAALWVAMLVINGQLSDHPRGDAGFRASSTQEMMQAWLEQNRILAELVQPTATGPIAPPYVPRPRSQRKQNWAIF